MKSPYKNLVRLVILLLFLVALGIAGRMVYWDVRQPELNSALIAAVKRSDTAAVVTLLSEGADPNARDLPPDTRALWLRLWDGLRSKPIPSGDGPTALLDAVSRNDKGIYPPENVPLVTALLNAGANVNVADRNGMPPLMWATGDFYKETAALLLARGAEVNARDNMGDTALDLSCQDGDTSLMRKLLARGALVNGRNNQGETALHIAAKEGCPNAVATLIASGGELNARDTGGDTPLLDAATRNEPDCMQLLLAHGAKANLKNDAGDTPLSAAQNNDFAKANFAQNNDRLRIIKMLTNAGAKE